MVESSISLALSLLELIALMMPVLAILLQVIIALDRQVDHNVFGYLGTAYVAAGMWFFIIGAILIGIYLFTVLDLNIWLQAGMYVMSIGFLTLAYLLNRLLDVSKSMSQEEKTNELLEELGEDPDSFELIRLPFAIIVLFVYLMGVPARILMRIWNRTSGKFLKLYEMGIKSGLEDSVKKSEEVQKEEST